MASWDSKSRPWPDVRRDVKHALRLSLRYGVVFLVIAVLQAVATKGASLSRYGLAYWQLPIVYVGGALIVGTLLGLLKPLTGQLRGAMVVGAIIAFPLVLGLSPIAIPTASLLARLATSLVTAAVLGPVYAWVMWRRPGELGNRDETGP